MFTFNDESRVTRRTCPDACLQRHTHWCRSRDLRNLHQKEQMSSFQISLSSTKISDMFATNVSLVRSLRCCYCWQQPQLAAFCWIFHYLLFNMESWHLPINLSAQIAPDYISEYLNFQNFPGGPVLRPPSMSYFGLSLRAPTRPYCISPQYAPLTLTNKKCVGMPLTSIINKPFSSSVFTLYHLMFGNLYQACH